MLEVADILRLHGATYRAQFGDRLLPSHARAMRDLEQCRTAYCGGHVAQCDHCAQQVYVDHSCRNRHCPKCHGDQTERWLDAQRGRLLPCPYYLLTLTLPSELRDLARAHQKVVYGLLMRCAAAALHTLARDPRFLGASIGCLAVLHTWTRALRYHPHVHLLVTAGGLSPDGTQWIVPKNPAYLVPVRALSVFFRAKVCAALKHAGLLPDVPVTLWKKPWVVHAQPAGRGQRVLDYLGRYVFRIAIANSRLEAIDHRTSDVSLSRQPHAGRAARDAPRRGVS
ncbi:MAG: IS91 family transposase [Vicinamibacterales bacterium]